MNLGLVLTSLLVTAEPSPAAETRLDPDLVYATVGGEALKLDLVRPKETGKPTPVVLLIHGGGWRAGSRKQYSIPLPFLGNRTVAGYLAARGFATAAVEYRLSPTHRFPAQIEDCKAAVKFLRAEAGKYHLDADAFAAVGDSAGGHLSCLLGLTGPGDGLEGPTLPGVSSRIQAVVDLYGPTDLTTNDWSPQVEADILKPFFGVGFADGAATYKKASPLFYAKAGAPPFLIFHGTEDTLVHIGQSRKLADKLKELGVPHELVEMKGDGHGWFGDKLKRTLDRAMDFADGVFKK